MATQSFALSGLPLTLSSAASMEDDAAYTMQNVGGADVWFLFNAGAVDAEETRQGFLLSPREAVRVTKETGEDLYVVAKYDDRTVIVVDEA